MADNADKALQQWQQFLQQQGAEPGWSDDEGPHFAGSDSSTEETALFYLSDQRCLLVSGPEAGKFLQGQLTCDLNTITARHSQLGAYCTPKGRMVANFRIARLDGDEPQYLLRMHHSIISSCSERLAKYIVFSKATQQPATQIICLGLAGPAAARLIEDVSGQPAGSDNNCVPMEGGVAIQVDDDGQRFELWLEADRAAALWPRLSSDARPTRLRYWQALEIAAGIGSVQAQTQEMFIPQMLNLQELDGISFKKGCYTGQEIVARMHYLGKLKRHMYRAGVAIEHLPDPGSPLYRDGNEQSIGNLVQGVATEAGNWEILAVINIADAEEHKVRLGSPNGPILQALPLPYAITIES